VRLGIDLGGTKIEILALDAQGRETLRSRVPTPQGDYEATLDAVAGLVHDAEAALRVATGSCSVGIGTPGSLSSASGLLRNSNSVCLNDRPIVRDLEARLRRRIAIANDANCFALSEATDGAGQGAAVVFGVILGTGVGGGWVVHGTVLEGRNGIAGEWGHNPLPWPRDDERPGPACYCGRAGCIETFLSGPGLASDHERAGGERIDGAALARRAAEGDATAEAALERYEDRLARALAHAINMVDPDVIVLGGGLSNLARLYDGVPRRWGRYVFSDRVDTQLRQHAHGDSSGVRGAAWLGGLLPVSAHSHG
jgi:fructokinase